MIDDTVATTLFNGINQQSGPGYKDRHMVNLLDLLCLDLIVYIPDGNKIGR
ncbi:hypothetical protein DSUL_50070 [Desulfovibrionales bacterium]